MVLDYKRGRRTTPSAASPISAIRIEKNKHDREEIPHSGTEVWRALELPECGAQRCYFAVLQPAGYRRQIDPVHFLPCMIPNLKDGSGHICAQLHLACSFDRLLWAVGMDINFPNDAKFHVAPQHRPFAGITEPCGRRNRWGGNPGTHVIRKGAWTLVLQSKVPVMSWVGGVCRDSERFAGGERGIRTPGRGVSPYNGLANRRLQPLGHLSGVTGRIISEAAEAQYCASGFRLVPCGPSCCPCSGSPL